MAHALRCLGCFKHKKEFVMIRNWLRGLLRARWPMLGAAALGVAIAVALLALLGLFVSHSASTMTARAVSAIIDPVTHLRHIETRSGFHTVDALPTTVVFDNRCPMPDVAAENLLET